MDQALPLRITAANGPGIFESRSCSSSSGTSSYPSRRSLSARLPVLNPAVSFFNRSFSRRLASRLGTRCCVAVNPLPRLRGARPPCFSLLMLVLSPPRMVSELPSSVSLLHYPADIPPDGPPRPAVRILRRHARLLPWRLPMKALAASL